MHGAGAAHRHVGGLLRPQAALLHEHGQPEAPALAAYAVADQRAVAEPAALLDGSR